MRLTVTVRECTSSRSPHPSPSLISLRPSRSAVMLFLARSAQASSVDAAFFFLFRLPGGCWTRLSRALRCVGIEGIGIVLSR